MTPAEKLLAKAKELRALADSGRAGNYVVTATAVASSKASLLEELAADLEKLRLPVVRKCGECASHREHEFGGVCERRPTRETPSPDSWDTPPAWCPLRTSKP